jgi:hypothetical protein
MKKTLVKYQDVGRAEAEQPSFPQNVTLHDIVKETQSRTERCAVTLSTLISQTDLFFYNCASLISPDWLVCWKTRIKEKTQKN